MARIVTKFGGTSVADIERIRNAAAHIAREHRAGNEVAAVVSAMAGRTNELVGWTREAGTVSQGDGKGGGKGGVSLHDAREYDAVVASGEQVTAGLLAIVLQGMGVPSRSYQGWQVPIHTDGAHGAARIKSIEGAGLLERMAGGEVPVVTGFQGLGPRGRITTLGRGGSDTSAVALAAALQATRCDIYTDVDGVYTTDPRIVPKARRIPRVSYEEMLEMASLGAKVLQTRSVEMAMNHNVRTLVRSSFADPELDAPLEEIGTLVCPEDEIMEQEVVTGIT
ncbi:MAG: aspartate kinase, partial [Pseudomonadota bacterium]